MLGNVAELQVAAGLTGAGQSTYHRAQTAAIDESDFSQVQDDGAPITEQPSDMGAQRFDFIASDKASLAADDGDAANIASFQRELQVASRGKATEDGYIQMATFNGSRGYSDREPMSRQLVDLGLSRRISAVNAPSPSLPLLRGFSVEQWFPAKAEDAVKPS